MKRWSAWGIVVAIMYLVAIIPAPVADAATAPSTSATAYHINAQHNGLQTDTLTPPLSLKWTTTLGGTASYPLIAQGKVFITAITTQGSGLLYAFNISTGKIAWGPLDIGSTNGFEAAAYDAGRIFTLNGTGVLAAFSATNGSQVWVTQITNQTSFSSPPTALNGLVYTGTAGVGGTVYAFRESNGTQVWPQSVQNGDDSSPTVSASGVYVSYACNQAYDFAPQTGKPIWHFQGPCTGF